MQIPVVYMWHVLSEAEELLLSRQLVTEHAGEVVSCLRAQNMGVALAVRIQQQENHKLPTYRLETLELTSTQHK